MQVGALCSHLLLIKLMGYAATSYADGLRATQTRAMQMGYADDTSYDAGGRAVQPVPHIKLMGYADTSIQIRACRYELCYAN